MRTAAAMALLLCACSGSPIDDKIAPVLSITSPDRGTYVAGDSVTVTGTLADAESGPGQVHINGVPADVADDGTFTANVPLAGGVTILETIGKDAAGNSASDHRGVLAGQSAPLGTVVRDAFVAALTPETFTVIGDVAATAVSNLDFVAIGNSVSPIVDRGNSCFGVEVDLKDINFSDLDVALTPVAGGVAVVFKAKNLDVDMRANWEISCFGGGAGLNISATTLTITGTLKLALVSGRFKATLEGAKAAFTGFDLDVGSIPDSIVNFFVDDIDDKVASQIINVAKAAVPGALESTLQDFSDSQLSAKILGVDVNMALTATEVEIGPEGGQLRLDFAASAPSLEGADYIATPQIAPSSSEMGGQSLGLAIADDVANQLLAVLWHGDALAAGITVEGTPLRDIIPAADSVTVDLLLPPVITTRPDSDLASIGIGDLMLTALDSAGQSLAVVAITGHVDVGVSLSDVGAPLLGADFADLSITVLSGAETLGLTSQQIQIFAEIGLAQVRAAITEVLANLKIPQFGAEIRSPSLAASGGYLLVSGQLATAE